MKYYKKYFKPHPGYKSEVLTRGLKHVVRLSAIPIVEHIKIKSNSNPFNSTDDKYFTQRYFTSKLRNNFSY